jgi:hypothetical protein
LTATQSGDVISATVDQNIEVTLRTIGPGEYGSPTLWSSVVTFEEMSYVQPPDPGGPKQLFRFKARSAGQCAIVIPHSPEGPEFSVVVVVE